MERITDSIELILPFKAEYVSVARLVASGVANRVGFDIESIEDIKVAVSEVCNKLVGTGSKSAGSYGVVFKVSANNLEIIFQCEDPSMKCIFSDEGDELGISIINALMDTVELCPDDGHVLTMSKAVEGNF